MKKCNKNVDSEGENLNERDLQSLESRKQQVWGKSPHNLCRLIFFIQQTLPWIGTANCNLIVLGSILCVI